MFCAICSCLLKNFRTCFSRVKKFFIKLPALNGTHPTGLECNAVLYMMLLLVEFELFHWDPEGWSADLRCRSQVNETLTVEDADSKTCSSFTVSRFSWMWSLRFKGASFSSFTVTNDYVLTLKLWAFDLIKNHLQQIVPDNVRWWEPVYRLKIIGRLLQTEMFQK